MTTASLAISCHSTPPELFDALSRVFPVTRHDESAWVAFEADGVQLTFFAPHAAPDTKSATFDEYLPEAVA